MRVNSLAGGFKAAKKPGGRASQEPAFSFGAQFPDSARANEAQTTPVMGNLTGA